MTRMECLKVQTYLHSLNLYHGRLDGIPGPMTRAAIRAFQHQHGLVEDGFAGPITLVVMFPPIVTEPVPVDPVGTFYKGAAKRLEPGDVARVANAIDVEPAAFAAVIKVESAGMGFDLNDRVLFLYEPHIAYRLSEGSVRSALVAAGVAYRRQGTKPYPRKSSDRVKQLEACIELGSEELAADSASWGLGQIMGFNAKVVGYMTAVAMVRAFAADEENQIAAMAAFILNNQSLHLSLKRHDWASFAAGWNGAAYRINNYDGKLAAAFAQYRA